MDTWAKLEQFMTATYGATINQLRAWYDSGFHHGHWCGPGGSGEPIDELDGCCRQHDSDYGTVGYSADEMWSPAALIATRFADHALATCAGTAQLDPHGDGAHGDAEGYRHNLINLFSTRSSIGESLHTMKETLDGALERIRRLGDYLPSFAANELPAETHEWVQSEIADLREQGIHDHEMGLA